jgi:hypothetical protein
MATAKQLRALEKAREVKKRKRLGLGGFKAPNKKDILDGFKNAGLILVGFVGGREVSRMVIKDDAEGFKRYLGSIVQVGGGVLLCTQKNEPLRYLGYGLMASGAVEATSKILNKDILGEGLLSGLSLGSILSGKKIPSYNPDQISLPPNYLPDLPPIEEDPVIEENSEDLVSGYQQSDEYSSDEMI